MNVHDVENVNIDYYLMQDFCDLTYAYFDLLSLILVRQLSNLLSQLKLNFGFVKIQAFWLHRLNPNPQPLNGVISFLY